MIPPQNVASWESRVACLIATGVALAVVTALVFWIFPGPSFRGTTTSRYILFVEDNEGRLLSVGCDGQIVTPHVIVPGNPELERRWQTVFRAQEMCR